MLKLPSEVSKVLLENSKSPLDFISSILGITKDLKFISMIEEFGIDTSDYKEDRNNSVEVVLGVNQNMKLVSLLTIQLLSLLSN